MSSTTSGDESSYFNIIRFVVKKEGFLKKIRELHLQNENKYVNLFYVKG